MSWWKKVLIGLAIVVALLIPVGVVYAVVNGDGGSHGHPTSGMMSGDMDKMHDQMRDHMSGQTGAGMMGNGGTMGGSGMMGGATNGGMSGQMGGMHQTGSTNR